MFSINNYNPDGFHFDEDGIAWLSANETVAITDPFLATIIITNNPTLLTITVRGMTTVI